MKHLSVINLTVMAIFILAGCKKNGGAPGNNVSVYVAGSDDGAVVYWKDETEYPLVYASSGYSAGATGIAVVNGDVYVSGTAGDTAVFWKNSVETHLSDPASGVAQATAIATSGTDVYIAGFQATGSGNSLLYWKNGSKTVVANSPNSITGISIAVSGTDVYISATIGNDTAACWKNGVWSTLGYPSASARGIAFTGGNLYVIGLDNGMPVYWKNGTETGLAHLGSTQLSGITVSGPDVYMTGTDGMNAVYWKNGAENVIAPGYGIAIAVSGSDVYVTGVNEAVSVYALPVYALYWKNGILVKFNVPPSFNFPPYGKAITLASH